MQPPEIEHPDHLTVPLSPATVAPQVTRWRLPILPVAAILVALLAGGALFISGYSMGRQTAVEPGTPVSADAAFRPFWDTYHTINERYAGGTVDRNAIVRGAIRGMIDALADPYSSYLTLQEYRDNLQNIGGEFEGIGAQIAGRATDGSGCATLGPTCRLVIVSPLVGSPAERAGLRAGDLVLATDGVPVDGLSVDSARQRIRGPKGSILTVSVLRAGDGPFDLTITREIIKQQEVKSLEYGDGAIGYVRLHGFSDRGADELVDALRVHLAAGRTKLILDLRGNPGGYVTAGRKVASQFIASGTLFWERDARGAQVPTEASPGGVATDPDIRVVCLIDRSSASASEIVAGALQDSGRATLVGERSFGKGTVQQWQELPGEGGAFRLTVASWLTPDKRSIHDVGLEPDVIVAVATDLGPDEDPILDKALEVLGATGSAAIWAEAA